jgi:hypothetical protein
VRWPSEFNDDGVWEPLPPKKPAESVRFAREEERLKKVVGAELQFRADSSSVTSPFSMAATAQAYLNSDGSTSGKVDSFSTRQSLENLFENCDLRPHHVNMIAAMWRAAGRPQGKEILLFAAVEGYRIEARYKSRRAVQYNLRALEQIGVIELAKGANTIRRPATYRLRTDALGKRQTYADVKNQRKAPQPISQSPSQSSPQAQDAAVPQPRTAPAAPVTPAESAGRFLDAKRGTHRTTERQLRQLSSRDAAKLIAKIAELMRGNTRHRQLDGYSFNLQPDDSRYRAPLSQEKALISACMTLGIPHEAAEEHLKLCHWKFLDSEQGP